MLGHVLGRQKEPRILEKSTVFADALMEHWREDREVIPITLHKQEEEWREFWLYASMAHKWCPRMYAQLAAAPVSADVKGAEDLWFFEQGNLYHDLIQQRVFSSFPEGVVLGSWERQVEVPGTKLTNVATGKAKKIYAKEEELHLVEGDYPVGNVVRGWGPRPEGEDWRYIEPKIRIPEYRIVVKPDAILNWPEFREVLEIKTEGIDAKEKLDPVMGGAPRPQHVVQVNIEMWAAGLEQARILYIFKGAKGVRPSFVEHVVRRDERLIEKVKARALKCVEAVSVIEHMSDELVEKGVSDEERYEALSKAAYAVPRLSDCPMKSKGKARYCDGRDACFPSGWKKLDKELGLA